MTPEARPKPDDLDRKALAAELAIAPKTVSEYLRLARRYAAEHGGKRQVWHMPEPAYYVGRSPVWRRRAIDLYKAGRLGRGAPGRRRQRVEAP